MDVTFYNDFNMTVRLVKFISSRTRK